MAKIDSHELTKWERGETEPSGLARRWKMFCNKDLPLLFAGKMSVGRLVFGGLRVLSLLSLALWPVWAKVFDYHPSLTWMQAVLISCMMSALLLYNFLYDRVTSHQKRQGAKKKAGQRLTNAIRGGIAQFAQRLKIVRKQFKPEAAQMIRETLGWIRDITRIWLEDYEGSEIDATLWVFANVTASEMKVLERTTTGRMKGQAYPSAEIMAYYIAKSRKHRVIDDFRGNHPFPKEGLSAPGAPRYRCILMIPLLDSTPGNPDTCLGVVSIDSARPYDFSPGSGEDLVLRLSPYCTWLVLLLGLDSPHRLSYPTP